MEGQLHRPGFCLHYPVTWASLSPEPGPESDPRPDQTVSMATTIAQSLHLAVASGVSQSDFILR